VLACQADISRYIRQNPFVLRCGPAQEEVQEEVQGDAHVV
jgi:hypothetical protein